MANNIIGGKQQVVFAKQTINIADTSLNASNTVDLYAFTPSLQSFVPGRPIDALKQLVQGEGYLLRAKVNMDLTELFGPPFDLTSTIEIVEDVDA